MEPVPVTFVTSLKSPDISKESIDIMAEIINSEEKKLSGEAYLNSRREYWRKEAANNRNLPKKKVSEYSNVLTIVLSVVVGGVFLALFAYFIALGGGPLLILFLLFIGALLLKCMR
jgi:hypothetical protein